MSTRLYSNAELGLRFEIDESFADGPPLVPSPGLPGNVRAAYLTAPAGGGRAILSISRVEVGYDTSPQELAEQLVIHNRYAAHTAEEQGWTLHSPWKAAMLAGCPAMRCDYVVPAPGEAAEAERGAGADQGAHGPGPGRADSGQEPQGSTLGGGEADAGSPGHVQAWVAYAGPVTWQIMLGVDPPGDLDANRRVMDQVARSFELLEPAG